MTVRDALDVYFKTSGFNESTYTDTWVKLPVLGGHVYLPNIRARRLAVPLHDIDHVLTMGGIGAPRASVTAFARGRRSRGVYGFQSRDEILHEDVAALRARLTSEPVRASFGDVVRFYVWFFASLIAHVLPLVAIALLIARIAR